MSPRQPTPRRPGRPPLPEGQGRTARAEWRTTPQRKAAAQRLAERAGLPLSEWLDACVDAAEAAQDGRRAR